MFRSFRFAPAIAGAVVSFAFAPIASAAVFGSAVTSYTSGTLPNPAYVNTAAAVGAPERVHSGGALTPFNPAFSTSSIVGVGAGGQLTIRFPQAVNVIAGPELGVINNVGFIDVSYPNGQIGGTPGFFTGARIADVEVSGDGTSFVPVGRFQFTLPANAYTNIADPFATSAPSAAVESDFGKPFTQPLSAFGGLNLSQAVALLDGSGGGTWLDVTPASGLGSFQFVRFSIPGAGITGSENVVYIDSIVAANAAVPEPGMIGAIAMAGVALLRRKK